DVAGAKQRDVLAQRCFAAADVDLRFDAKVFAQCGATCSQSGYGYEPQQCRAVSHREYLRSRTSSKGANALRRVLKLADRVKVSRPKPRRFPRPWRGAIWRTARATPPIQPANPAE